MGLFKKTPEELYEKAMQALKTGRYERAVEYFSKAAEENHGQAWYRLASCYEEGRGVEENEEEALNCYHKAAELGVDDAWVELGYCYRLGRGTGRNCFTALYCYEQAAARGNVEAMRELGAMHGEGIGIPRDEKEGMEWYVQAAMHGDREAMAAIGRMYATGAGVEKDEKMAAEWYQKAAEYFDSCALAEVNYARNWLTLKEDEDWDLIPEDEWKDVARQLYLDGDYKLCCEFCEYLAMVEEIDLEEKKADSIFGDVWTGFALPYQSSVEMLKKRSGKQVYATAEEYWDAAKEMKSQGCPEAANQYYEKAAELGMAKALTALGAIYLKGDGVPADTAKGNALIAEAAKRGCATALRNLGISYRKGLYGHPKNPALGEEYLKKAVEAGCTMAGNDLGFIYKEEKKDLEQAISWYQKGEELGSSYAAYNLAWIYRGQGQYHDLQKELWHYKKAAELDHADACRELGLLYLYGAEPANDYDLAEEYLQKARELGDRNAYLYLGDLYSLDRCGKVEGPKAFYFLKKAAREGEPIAQEMVGKYYYSMAMNFNKGNITGLTVKARKWMESAAEQNYEPAIEWLKDHKH